MKKLVALHHGNENSLTGRWSLFTPLVSVIRCCCDEQKRPGNEGPTSQYTPSKLKSKESGSRSGVRVKFRFLSKGKKEEKEEKEEGLSSPT